MTTPEHEVTPAQGDDVTDPGICDVVRFCDEKAGHEGKHMRQLGSGHAPDPRGDQQIVAIRLIGDYHHRYVELQVGKQLVCLDRETGTKLGRELHKAARRAK